MTIPFIRYKLQRGSKWQLIPNLCLCNSRIEREGKANRNHFHYKPFKRVQKNTTGEVINPLGGEGPLGEINKNLMKNRR